MAAIIADVMTTVIVLLTSSLRLGQNIRLNSPFISENQPPIPRDSPSGLTSFFSFTSFSANYLILPYIITLLLRFAMHGMLIAKFAMLLRFHPVGVVLFFLHHLIIPLFTVNASHRYLRSHLSHLAW
jgi:hypothetical protein